MTGRAETASVIASVEKADGLYYVIAKLKGQEVHATSPRSYPIGKQVVLREIAGGYVIE